MGTRALAARWPLFTACEGGRGPGGQRGAGESERESGAWAGLGGRLFQVSQEEQEAAGDPSVDGGCAGGARAERWAGKPTCRLLWGRGAAGARLRDDFRRTRQPGGGPVGVQAPSAGAWVLEEGSARGLWGLHPCPARALCSALGSHMNWGLPAPGRAVLLLVESHNETEEGVQGPGGVCWHDGPWWGREPGGQEAKEISGAPRLPLVSGTCLLVQEAVRDLGRRAPEEAAAQPTPGSLPRASCGQRSPRGHTGPGA